MPKQRSQRNVDDSPSQGDSAEDLGLLILSGYGTWGWGKRRRVSH